MATKVHMEALSPTMEEGQLVRWLKKEGDAVSEGDVLAEIETDKATMELVARGAGVLRKVMLAEGGTAPVGAVIGVIGTADEDVSAVAGDAGGGGSSASGSASASAEKPEADAEQKQEPPAEEKQEPPAEQKQQPAGAQKEKPDAQQKEPKQEHSDGGSQTSVEQGGGTDAWGRRKASAGKEEASEDKDVEVAAAAVATTDKTEQSSAAETGKAVPAAAGGQTAVAAPPAGADAGKRGEGNGQPDGGRVKASPLARKLAAESGVELHSVQGSGPGGRITKRDIEAAGSASPAAAAPGAQAPASTPAGDAKTAAGEAPRPVSAPAATQPQDVQELPVTQMRKTIAKRLVTSIGPVPTFYLTIEVDMTRTQEMRERLNARLKESGGKTSVNDFIIRAAAEALRRHPEVNASWGDTVIRRYGRVHVGVAVAVEDGLITPVIHDADRKGVAQIAAEVRELAGRAREKKLKPEEYTGATFSISNLGMFGIEEFTAIINPPESAILAVGRVEEKAVVENGEVVVRPRMRLTMSCDHRVVDGATGAKFLQTLREFLEDPLMIIA